MKNKTHSEILDFYFDDESNPSLDSKIQRWLVSEPEAREKDKALKRIWNRRVRDAVAAMPQLNTTVFHSPGEGSRRIRSFRPARILSRVAAVFAGFIVMSGVLLLLESRLTDDSILASLFGPNESDVPMIELGAGDAGKVYAELPDGSQVWIHRHGSVSYAEDFESNRVVKLTGEAYFSVTKQNGKPFTVESDDLSVRVLGTEFLVKGGADLASSQVGVAEGAVQVKLPGSKKYKLGPTDNLTYSKGSGEAVMGKIDISEIAPWKNLDLDFRDATLNEVFERIGDYFGLEMQIASGVGLDQRLTATFHEDEPVEEILSIISMTLNTFDFRMEENNVIIIGR